MTKKEKAEKESFVKIDATKPFPPPLTDEQKELKRQLDFILGSNYKEQNPIKFASRVAELEEKLAKFK